MDPNNLFDKNSWRVVIPQKVKRQNYSKGFGLCGGFPVGSSTSSHKEGPTWWHQNEPRQLTFSDRKELGVRQGRGNEMVGFWIAKGGGQHGAVLWRVKQDGALEEIELHAPVYEQTYGMAVGRGVQAGFGYPKVKRGEYSRSKPLIWRGSSEAIELRMPDGGEGEASGTDGQAHVGQMNQHAVLWNDDAAAPVILSSTGVGSTAQAVRDGEQVGAIWKKMAPHAALWKGTPDSLVDLTPKGFEASNASDCAQGFQVGFIKKKDLTPSGSSEMMMRAVLWNGGQEFLDLQALLPEPWNSSHATFIDFDGDTVRIVGTAEHVTTTGPGLQAAQCLSGSTIVMWEGKRRA